MYKKIKYSIKKKVKIFKNIYNYLEKSIKKYNIL